MPTQNEIFDRLLAILDMVAMTGFFSEEELEEINTLEKLYYIQA